MSRMARGAVLLLGVLLLGPGSVCLSRPGTAAEPPAAPAPTTKDPSELRLPPDLVYEGGAEGPGVVIFRHTTHAPLTGNNCLTCHPQLFKLVHPERKTSHDEMTAGKACGACHDGKKAFGITETENCQTCHVEAAPAAARPGPGGTAAGAPGRPEQAGSQAPQRSGPQDIKLAKSEGSPGTVTFRHSSHGGAAAKCARCHPGLFPMKASAKPLDYPAMLQGGTCGACHNGKEAFGVDDSERCERCHAAEGAKP